MKKEKTLLERYSQKRNLRRFFITLVIISIPLVIGIFIYFNHIASKQDDVLGQKDVSKQEIILQNDKEEDASIGTNNINNESLSESEMPKTETTPSAKIPSQVKTSVSTTVPTVATEPATISENKCSELTIQSYKNSIQSITENKNSLANNLEAHLAEDFTQCQNNYDYCMEKVDDEVHAFLAEMANRGLSRSGMATEGKAKIIADGTSACQNTQKTCTNTALYNSTNDSQLIQYNNNLVNYQNLLNSCY